MIADKLMCLFCGTAVPNIPTTFRTTEINHEQGVIQKFRYNSYHVPEVSEDEIQVQTMKCPSCSKVSVDILGVGNQYKNQLVHFYPLSLAKKYPEYIPQQIREDYEEAHAIVNLSPKASATLSRRCIQGMIRDFWGISKKRLVDEINALDNLVSSNTKSVLHALRDLGNIGAHPESDINTIIDIEPHEAYQLLQFIELLMQQWYIERKNSTELLKNIIEINQKKKP